jgi:hypothetical protein
VNDLAEKRTGASTYGTPFPKSDLTGTVLRGNHAAFRLALQYSFYYARLSIDFIHTAMDFLQWAVGDPLRSISSTPSIDAVPALPIVPVIKKILVFEPTRLFSAFVGGRSLSYFLWQHHEAIWIVAVTQHNNNPEIALDFIKRGPNGHGIATAHCFHLK